MTDRTRDEIGARYAGIDGTRGTAGIIRYPAALNRRGMA
jgi:hypothetical protein